MHKHKLPANIPIPIRNRIIHIPIKRPGIRAIIPIPAEFRNRFISCPKCQRVYYPATGYPPLGTNKSRPPTARDRVVTAVSTRR